MCTHHQISYNICKKEKRDARPTGNYAAPPHGVNPLATQDSKHDHEGVEEVIEVPSRHSFWMVNYSPTVGAENSTRYMRSV